MKTQIVEKIIDTLYNLYLDYPNDGIDIGIQREFGKIMDITPYNGKMKIYREQILPEKFIKLFTIVGKKGGGKPPTYTSLVRKLKGLDYVEVNGLSYEEVYMRLLGMHSTYPIVMNFFNKFEVNKIFVPKNLTIGMVNDLIIYKNLD